MKLLKDFMINFDEKATRAAVETELFKALLTKLTTFDDDRKEATITASYELRESQRTNVTSDSTADVAIFNVMNEETRKRQLWLVERAVSRLNPKQRTLINERYLTATGVQDQDIYHGVMGMSWKTYNKIRSEAIYMIAITLNIYVEKEGNNDA